MKLFVAKLNREAVESDLLEWFSAMGPVRSAKVVVDRDTGQSKCFGFVEMESQEAGEKAIAEMNGQEFMGFRMVVKEAEERGAKPRSAGTPFGNREGAERGARPATNASRQSEGPAGFSPNSGGSSAGKKSTKKVKASRQKPDKYSDGPRQTKMKKARGGGGSKGWADLDDDY